MNDVKNSKSELRRQLDTVDSFKRNADAAAKSSDAAKAAFEKADRDMNVTKAHVEKLREQHNIAFRKAHDAANEFQRCLEATAAFQKKHYEVEMPAFLSSLEAADEARVSGTKSCLLEFVNSLTTGVLSAQKDTYQVSISACDRVSFAKDLEQLISEIRTIPMPIIPDIMQTYGNVKTFANSETTSIKSSRSMSKANSKLGITADDSITTMPLDKGRKLAADRLTLVDKELADMEKRRAGVENLCQVYRNQVITPLE